MDISEAQKENMVYINERGFPVNQNSLTGSQLLEMAGEASSLTITVNWFLTNVTNRSSFS
jgi:hypothetical protein